MRFTASKTFLIALTTLGLAACASAPPSKKSSITKVMEEHREEFSGCYAKLKKPKEGKVKLSFVITPAGKVTESKVASSTLKRKVVERCMLGVLKGIQFNPNEIWGDPLPTAGTKVTYPLTFKKNTSVATN